MVEVGRVGGDTVVVAVTGEMDLSTAPRFTLALDDAIGSASRVIVDLTAATFIDSTAIAAVVRAARELDPSLRCLSVVLDPRSQPGRIWTLVGLSPPIPRFASRSDAELRVAVA
jgi:anti-sigma B factor antagonist